MPNEKYINKQHSNDRNLECKAKHIKLFHDKRVHSILSCPICGEPMTAAEAKRNHGVCDYCTTTIEFELEV